MVYQERTNGFGMANFSPEIGLILRVFSVLQHVLYYPTVHVPMKVKSPALIREVNLGCLMPIHPLLVEWRSN